jgi:alkylation response protein AidB-like acyl-CoA dehydrogenase
LSWPEKYGGKNASPLYQLILAEELERYRCPGYDIFGVGMIAPTLIQFGSEEQKREHLPGIAGGEVIWCECLSEPDSGSDLGSLKTLAVEDGDYFVINGQKVWTSGAHGADWCILLVRTDRELPKHKGLGLFLVDMKMPGVSTRPIINATGDHEFNEVFFDEVRVPRRNLVGGKTDGWKFIMGLLSYERSTAVPFYVVARRYFEDILQYARQMKGLSSKAKQRISELAIECELAKLLAYRAAWMQGKRIPFDPEAAEAKLYATELNQRIAAFGMEFLGLYGSLTEGSKWAVMDGRAAWYCLRSIGNTLEAGSSEVDRDIVAARGLGLPRR